MSQPLPYNDFRWETEYNKVDGRGYILEVDLELDEETKQRTARFPLAPVKKLIDINDLSTHQRLLNYTKDELLSNFRLQLNEQNLTAPKIIRHLLKTYTKEEILERLPPKITKVQKLICDLKNKEKYVIHYRTLEYYQKLGMKVTKIHRIISFREEAWLAPYTEFNTNIRTNTNIHFEKDFFKLMNNAF